MVVICAKQLFSLVFLKLDIEVYSKIQLMIIILKNEKSYIKKLHCICKVRLTYYCALPFLRSGGNPGITA